MPEHSVNHAATKAGLTIAPSLDLVIEAAQVPPETSRFEVRTIWLCGIAIGLGLLAAVVAQLLVKLIAIITNLSFYGVLSFDNRGPADNRLGLFVIGIPIVGALVVGFMARYGSKAIRGHG